MGGVHARRRGRTSKSAAPQNRGMVRPGACRRVQLRKLRSESYKKAIREAFGDATGKIRVAKSGNKIMFLLTKCLRFLDIINYLGPGTSYEKWVKAYDCEAEKSWLPY